jgi:hypothetical protein
MFREAQCHCGRCLQGGRCKLLHFCYTMQRCWTGQRGNRIKPRKGRAALGLNDATERLNAPQRAFVLINQVQLRDLLGTSRIARELSREPEEAESWSAETLDYREQGEHESRRLGNPSEAALRVVLDGEPTDLEFVILRLPDEATLKQARESEDPGGERASYNPRTLVRLHLLWPRISDLRKPAVKWVADQIIALRDERLRRSLTRRRRQPYSRQVVVCHCHDHERFNDAATWQVLEVYDPRTPLPANLRPYLSRGRRVINEQFGGECPINDEDKLPVTLRVALMKARELMALSDPDWTPRSTYSKCR